MKNLVKDILGKKKWVTFFSFIVITCNARILDQTAKTVETAFASTTAKPKVLNFGGAKLTAEQVAVLFDKKAAATASPALLASTIKVPGIGIIPLSRAIKLVHEPEIKLIRAHEQRKNAILKAQKAINKALRLKAIAAKAAAKQAIAAAKLAIAAKNRAKAVAAQAAKFRAIASKTALVAAADKAAALATQAAQAQEEAALAAKIAADKLDKAIEARAAAEELKDIEQEKTANELKIKAVEEAIAAQKATNEAALAAAKADTAAALAKAEADKVAALAAEEADDQKLEEEAIAAKKDAQEAREDAQEFKALYEAALAAAKSSGQVATESSDVNDSAQIAQKPVEPATNLETPIVATDTPPQPPTDTEVEKVGVPTENEIEIVLADANNSSQEYVALEESSNQDDKFVDWLEDWSTAGDAFQKIGAIVGTVVAGAGLIKAGHFLYGKYKQWQAKQQRAAQPKGKEISKPIEYNIQSRADIAKQVKEAAAANEKRIRTADATAKPMSPEARAAREQAIFKAEAKRLGGIGEGKTVQEIQRERIAAENRALQQELKRQARMADKLSPEQEAKTLKGKEMSRYTGIKEMFESESIAAPGSKYSGIKEMFETPVATPPTTITPSAPGGPVIVSTPTTAGLPVSAATEQAKLLKRLETMKTQRESMERIQKDRVDLEKKLEEVKVARAEAELQAKQAINIKDALAKEAAQKMELEKALEAQRLKQEIARQNQLEQQAYLQRIQSLSPGIKSKLQSWAQRARERVASGQKFVRK